MADIRSRIFLWDNVKAILILLVVVGHFAEQFTPESNVMNSIFLTIYTFHMPLFVFVSGLFAKSSIKKGKLQIHKVVSYLILFYALKLANFLVGLPFGKVRKFYLFTESGIPWYMFAMAAFICLIYILRRVNPKILFPASILASLLVGFFPRELDVLCFSRIVVFFPFFLIGYYMDSVKMAEFTRNPKWRIASAIILAGFIVICFVGQPLWYEFRPLLTARNTYYTLPLWPLGPIYRLFYYAIAAIISLAFISILPNRKTFFSYMGAATLPIYFLHRPIIYILMDCGFGGWLSDSFGIIGLGIFLLIGVGVTVFLSIKPIRKPFNKLLQCRYGLDRQQS